MTSFPSWEIPSDPLDLLMINGTTLRGLRTGDLEGKSVASLVLEDNDWLSEMGADAFCGLANTTYLRAERNAISVMAEEWGGDLFAPFRWELWDCDVILLHFCLFQVPVSTPFPPLGVRAARCQRPFGTRRPLGP